MNIAVIVILVLFAVVLLLMIGDGIRNYCKKTKKVRWK